MAGDNGPVVKYLERMNYADIRPLGKGSYGDVLSALCPNRKEVAVKIIPKKSSWIIEEQIWPVFDHPNILPVLDVIPLPQFGLKLFVSPRLPTSLFSVVQTTEFRSDSQSLNRVRKWLKDVLRGLDYLHSAGFAHMDVKTDNVLITSEDSAVLCDFSGLAITELKVRRLCAPLEFRPPECWQDVGAKGVDGVPFDMWTYGIMALNVLAGHWPQMNFGMCSGWTWEVDAKPVLSKALNEAALTFLMKQAMPCTKIEQKDVECASDFLLQVLKRNPSQRPTAQQAAGHRFLCISRLEPGAFQSAPLAVEIRGGAASGQLLDGKCVGFANPDFERETESKISENEVPPSGVRGAPKGIAKRLATWLFKKVRRIAKKRHGYVSLKNEE